MDTKQDKNKIVTFDYLTEDPFGITSKLFKPVTHKPSTVNDLFPASSIISGVLTAGLMVSLS